MPPAPQIRPPAQGCGVSVGQDPVPLQNAVGVSMSPEHAGRTQTVVLDVCSHAPPAAHLPSLPHGGDTTHCPVGACVPASWLAHVPFAAPVRTFVHAWQVPVQALLQHTPPAQNPLAHWSVPVHAVPSAALGTHAPAEQ